MNQEEKGIIKDIGCKGDRGYVAGKEDWVTRNLSDLEDSIHKNLINPDYYKATNLQVILQMMVLFPVVSVADFCRINAYKYQARAGLKGNAMIDHEKADWYLRLYAILRNYEDDDRDKAIRAVRYFLKEEEKNERTD